MCAKSSDQGYSAVPDAVGLGRWGLTPPPGHQAPKPRWTRPPLRLEKLAASKRLRNGFVTGGAWRGAQIKVLKRSRTVAGRFRSICGTSLSAMVERFRRIGQKRKNPHTS